MRITRAGLGLRYIKEALVLCGRREYYLAGVLLLCRGGDPAAGDVHRPAAWLCACHGEEVLGSPEIGGNGQVMAWAAEGLGATVHRGEHGLELENMLRQRGDLGLAGGFRAANQEGEIWLCLGEIFGLECWRRL